MKIGQMEDAIIKRVTDAMTGEAPVLAWKAPVRTFGADLAAGIEKAVRHFPAVVVTYTGATHVRGTRQTVNFRHTWNVLCCARSLRNEQEGRRGGQSVNPGSYQMAGDLAMLLHGFALRTETADKQISDLIVVRAVRPVLNDVAGTQQLASIYSVDIEVMADMSVISEGVTDLFALFHANWDIPVFGNVSTTLPADETADATDHVTLQETD